MHRFTALTISDIAKSNNMISNNRDIPAVVAKTNAESIECMQDGEYGRAGEILIEAIDLMRRHMQGPKTAEEDEKSTFPTDPVGNFEVESLELPLTMSTMNVQGTALWVYSCAFSLPSVPVTHSEKGVALMTILQTF